MPKQKSTYLGDELFEGREIISILKHLALTKIYTLKTLKRKMRNNHSSEY